jgi:hypothetical protein
MALACFFGVWELALQAQESWYVRSVSLGVIQDAGAATSREKVVALRDYIQNNVTTFNAPFFDKERPFLRATASETLKSGLGYCGEDTRTFICMANNVGLRAQRINLTGKKLHVVAEVELAPDQKVLVDCQNPPAFIELTTLDEVVRGPVYEDYFTINLRRLRIGWLISRLKLHYGPWDYVLERPHVMKAGAWGVLVASLLSLKALRWLIRRLLKSRGWVHRSNLAPMKPDPSPDTRTDLARGHTIFPGG